MLSRNVKAVSIDNTAKCIWFPGHFDLGSRYNTFPYQGMDGMMPRKLCNKFHQDCEVYFFNRVLCNSTPRFVGPSIRPSFHPSVRPPVRPSVRPSRKIKYASFGHRESQFTKVVLLVIIINKISLAGGQHLTILHYIICSNII